MNTSHVEPVGAHRYSPDPQPRDHDRDDEIPDTPLDEPAVVPRIDPPPPVTPGPYVSQEGYA